MRDGEGCSCIHLAAQFGHTAIVAYLVARGANVNLMDKNGMTPLMWSAYRVTRCVCARVCVRACVCVPVPSVCLQIYYVFSSLLLKS